MQMSIDESRKHRVACKVRYNHEERRSASGFIGWNLEFGKTVTLQLTPMFGALVRHIDGIVPALELDLVWRPSGCSRQAVPWGCLVPSSLYSHRSVGRR